MEEKIAEALPEGERDAVIELLPEARILLLAVGVVGEKVGEGEGDKETESVLVKVEVRN